MLEKHQVRYMEVYLEPLIKETLLLWNNIKMHDISQLICERSFKMYDVICWTIHDFPRFGP